MIFMYKGDPNMVLLGGIAVFYLAMEGYFAFPLWLLLHFMMNMEILHISIVCLCFQASTRGRIEVVGGGNC